MDTQTYEKKREELYTAHKSIMDASGKRLEELHVEARTIEESCEEISHFHQTTKAMLNQCQYELSYNDDKEDLNLFHQVGESVHTNCTAKEYELAEMKEDVEKERKKIFNDREDYEREYKRALTKLDEEKKKNS